MFKCSLMGCCEKCEKSALNVIRDGEYVEVWCAFQETCGEYEKWRKNKKAIKENMEKTERELMESITFPDAMTEYYVKKNYKKMTDFEKRIVKEMLEEGGGMSFIDIGKSCVDMSMEGKVMLEIREAEKREKPPIGTAPNWIAIPQRIIDLAKAITRNAGDYRMNTDEIREWAQEIILHCDTMDKLKNGRKAAPGFRGGKIPKC